MANASRGWYFGDTSCTVGVLLESGRLERYIKAACDAELALLPQGGLMQRARGGTQKRRNRMGVGTEEKLSKHRGHGSARKRPPEN